LFVRFNVYFLIPSSRIPYNDFSGKLPAAFALFQNLTDMYFLKSFIGLLSFNIISVKTRSVLGNQLSGDVPIASSLTTWCVCFFFSICKINPKL